MYVFRSMLSVKKGLEAKTQAPTKNPRSSVSPQASCKRGNPNRNGKPTLGLWSITLMSKSWFKSDDASRKPVIASHDDDGGGGDADGHRHRDDVDDYGDKQMNVDKSWETSL